MSEEEHPRTARRPRRSYDAEVSDVTNGYALLRVSPRRGHPAYDTVDVACALLPGGGDTREGDRLTVTFEAVYT